MTTPGGAGTLRRHCNFSRARRTGFSHKVGAFGLQGTAPLSQIETFATFCGIVWLRAKVLGRMGWTTSPHLRAGALSCLSLAIDGPGSYGAPAFLLAPIQRSAWNRNSRKFPRMEDARSLLRWHHDHNGKGSSARVLSKGSLCGSGKEEIEQ